MKTIRPTAVLDYYDGVEIFEGQDALGGIMSACWWTWLTGLTGIW